MWLCRFGLIALWFIVGFCWWDLLFYCYWCYRLHVCVFACVCIDCGGLGWWFDDCFAGGFGGVLLLRGAFWLICLWFDVVLVMVICLRVLFGVGACRWFACCGWCSFVSRLGYGVVIRFGYF